jgi:hypothetical protein
MQLIQIYYPWKQSDDGWGASPKFLKPPNSNVEKCDGEKMYCKSQMTKNYQL